MSYKLKITSFGNDISLDSWDAKLVASVLEEASKQSDRVMEDSMLLSVLSESILEGIRNYNEERV